jgi:integrase
MPKLTKRITDEAKACETRFFVWDDELPGFGLLVLPSGVKSFVLQYRNLAGRSRRYTIGRYGVMTVDEARTVARQALVKVEGGGDPVAARQSYRQAPTMNDLFDRYLKEHVAVHNQLSTQKDVAALIEKHLRPRMGAIKANDVKRADLAKVHHAMRETPRRANIALAILSKVLSLAELWGARPENSNPCGLIPRYPENHRKRFLNASEVQKLGEALVEAETFGLPWHIKGEKLKHLAKEENRRTLLSWQVVAAIRLLLLTGARLTEVITLKWTDIDTQAGTMALPDKKGGKREPHPVASAALALIASLPRKKGSPYLFPRDSDPKRPISSEVMENGWQRLRWHCDMEDVRLHDLRHTVGTYAAQAGVSGFIVRDLLRHRNITTTGRYANFDSDPVRNVSNIVGERIAASLAGQEGAKIVPLHKG